VVPVNQWSISAIMPVIYFLCTNIGLIQINQWEVQFQNNSFSYNLESCIWLASLLWSG
jgi:hypothetical protein